VNRKKIFIILLLGIFACFCFYGQESEGGGQEGAKEAASNGQDLSGYSTAELIGARDNCGSEEQSTFDTLQAEITLRDQMAAAAAAEAAAAESMVCDAVKEYQEEQQKIDDIKNEFTEKLKEMTSVSDKIEALKERNQLIKDQKEVVKDKYEQLCTAADAMNNAYKKLALTYEKYGIVGDPVRLAGGSFIAEYKDFEAQDYLDKFVVSRKLKVGNYGESFGPNWWCSLDSRIIRCVNEDVSEYIAILEKVFPCYEKTKATLEFYNETFPKYPSEEVNGYLEAIETDRTDFEERIKLLQQLNGERKQVLPLNRYVTYGPYSNEKNLWGYNEILKFLDEDGFEQVFMYADNGCWKNLSEINKADAVIYSIDSSGNVVSSKFGEGYLISYLDGKKKYFSKYGILEKIVDRNGNEEIYGSENGRINKVILKTGEVISVRRNSSGYITEISGSTSGNAVFTYGGNRLKAVKDVFEVVVGFSYDGEGDLVGISKADGTSITIGYEFSNVKNKKVCTSITNENGNRESFVYKEGNQIIHTTVSGGTEIFEINSLGNTVYAKNCENNETFLETNAYGLITKEKSNEFTKSFSYDGNYDIQRIDYENGGFETYDYDIRGFITAHTDADGFCESYEYDEKNNVIAKRYCNEVISSVEYYGNGLIKKITEGKITEGKRTVSYEYNRFGSVSKRVEKNSRFKWENKDETWNYDNRNRVTRYNLNNSFYVDYEYKLNSYGTYDVYEYWNGTKKVIRKFDGRNREVETIEIDVGRNISYSKKCVFDGQGKIRKVYLNNVLFGEYSYSPDGKLTSYLVWNNCDNKTYVLGRQGIFTEIKYAENGLVSSEIQSVVYEASGKSDKAYGLVDKNRVIQSNSFGLVNGHLIVKAGSGGAFADTFEYDNRGLLVQTKYADGYVKNYVYSKAGRLILMTDSSGNQWDFEYKTDGTRKVSKVDSNKNVEAYFYDENGLLIKSSKGALSYSYDYDSYGNLIKQVTPRGYSLFTYDQYGRLVSEKKYSYGSTVNVETLIEYDDRNLVQSISIGGQLYKKNKYDVWDRIIEENGPCGKIFYEYDCLGNCVSQKNQNGKMLSYEYAANGKMALVIYPDGKNCFNQFLTSGECVYSEKKGHVTYEANYRITGQLESYTDVLGNTTKLDYYSSGVLYSVANYDSGKTVLNSFSKADGKYFQTVDEYDNKFIKKFEKSGMKITETNQLGKNSVYEYYFSGKLKSKTDFSGKKNNYSYSFVNGYEQTDFWNGEKSFVYKNAFGDYEKLKNDNSSLVYEYDFKGLLSRSYDEKLKLEVLYEYDSFMRCVRKYNSYFDFKYEYDVLGRLSKLKNDKTGMWVSLVYDENSYDEEGVYKEIKRIYSNGNVVLFGYNDFGFRSYVVVTDKNGKILKGDFVIYDSFGRIKTIIDEKGDFKTFEYDNHGRLVKVLQKWDENQKSFNLQEAAACGIYFKDKEIKETYYSLAEADKVVFENQLKSLGLKDVIKVNENQPCWEETYSYNKNGSLVELVNPVGRFIYEYDSMNRVTSKHGVNSISRGKKVLWDADGNLVEIESCTGKVSFTYGAMNRPVKVWRADFSSGEETVIEYTYDALGRRIYEKLNGAEAYGYVYDGASGNVIFVSPMMADNSASVNTIGNAMVGDFSSRLSYDYFENTSSKEDFGDYSEVNQFKLVSGDFVPFQDNTYIEESDNFDSSPIYDLRPYSIMNIGNKPVEISYITNGKTAAVETEQVFQNILGQSVFTCDVSGEIFSRTDFDVWGNVITNGKNQFYSNSSMRLKSKNILFDFGLRDYLPEINGFISMDPARKGSNWFGYSICDPVNYGDNNGLFKEGLTDAQEADYAATISEFIKYNRDEMLTEGEWNGMPFDFNCTEVSSYIDDYVNNKLGIETTSEMEKKFNKAMKKKNTKEAADSVCSEYIYNDKDGKNAVKTSDKLADLADPDVVTPGTVLVWSPNEKTKSGHTMTVLARKFDGDGNVVGFTYIEGHLSSKKLTELGYCSIDGSYWKNDISYWRGNYEGTYELNGANTSTNCSK